MSKLIAALVGAALVVLTSALSDGHMTVVEDVQVAISVATACGVWITANVPAMTWAKTAIAALLAALNLVVTYLAAGPITGSEWANIGIAVLTALGVYAIPNKGASVTV
jgi:hypothetical protein